MEQFRHEWKHPISYMDRLAVRQRMQAVAQPDPHAIDGKYEIRSLYFDTPGDRALREKINGVSRREKFRIRIYNGDAGFIRLEKKSKYGGLGQKQSVPLTAEQVRDLLDGKLDWMRGDPLLEELRGKMQSQLLKPKVIVDYTREPFIYGPGNVRVTLDYDIRTGLSSTDFLNPRSVTIPAGDPQTILEVKWDAFLPSVIQDALQLEGRRACAFSKYAVCRIYG